VGRPLAPVSAATPGSQRPARGPLVALLIAALTATVVLTLWAAGAEDAGNNDTASSSLQRGPFRGNPLPSELAGRPAPSFRLRDARGGWLSSAALRGRPYALTFLYTNCPDVCPLIGQEMRQSLELLEREADRVAVAAVSVDPEGDTAEAVRLRLRRMRLPANFHYLIGTQTQLRLLWTAYFAAPSNPTSSRACTQPASGSSTRAGAGAPNSPAGCRSHRPTSRTTCASC
jgi:protein SCO1